MIDLLRHARPLFFAAALAACGRGQPAPAVVPCVIAPPAAFVTRATPEPHLPRPSFDALRDERRAAAMTDVVAEATTAVRSLEFVAQLASMHDLYANPDDLDAVDGAAVAVRYLGLDGAPHQAPTSYEAKTFLGADVPCGATASTALQRAGGFTVATTLLHACTFDRAERSRERPDDVAKFACAVNTVAHEWAHAVPGSPESLVPAYTDASRGEHPERKLVSYTVGALAQCVYLSTHHHPLRDLPRCVDQVGTAVFRANTCTEAWASVLQ